ncbi:MAG: hypothetical protein ACI91R_002218 [Vicingaceae bacterium]|jgi:hypothetical protein|tara:strand:+ start:284 stop:649 length:366 start_codon:yes stop_codon:yes gene_type:complete
MEYFIILLKLIVGLSILNVWLVNSKKPSRWRGGSAQTIHEEFSAYGLPTWSVYVIGTAKVGLAILLLASIQFQFLEKVGAFGLFFFLSGSVLMHLKIKDPLFKSIPAASFLILCLGIVYLS